MSKRDFKVFLVILILMIWAVMLILVADSFAAEISITQEYVEITAGPESAVYVPDCTEDTPYNEEVPLSDEIQFYLWEKCKSTVPDRPLEMYVFMLGLIDRESDFKESAYHKNTNGSKDRGLCQINSCWIKTFKKLGYISGHEDLYDPKTSIDCCFWELSHKLEEYGISERLYYYYNTGKTTGSSNHNSRAMVKEWNRWKEVFARYTEVFK